MMKKQILFLMVFISSFSFGQEGPKGKYINDGINELNYIIFYPDFTFKYRYMLSLFHDISCGRYRIENDTIFLTYLTDLRDSSCNDEIDAKTHFDSTLFLLRPKKLYYENEKLFGIKNGKVIKKIITNLKPPKSWGYRRRHILFWQYVKDDVYYMLSENQFRIKYSK